MTLFREGRSRLGVFALFCLAGHVALPQVVPSQTVHIIVSSNEGDRLAVKPDVQFEERRASAGASFQIDDRAKYQKMAGFGASFLEAGIMVLNSLPPEKQEQVLRSLFDPKEGAGFTAMKTPIAGTDFQSAGPWYTYDDTPGDLEMEHFSIERDLAPTGLVTYIKRARQYGSFVLQAPMDYPPDWMLYDVKKKQDIDPKYFPALARYYVRYLEEYHKQGIDIDYLSLFNEPAKVYTKIPYQKIRVLLRDHVGPAVAQSGLSAKIMLSEAPERENAFKSYPIVLDDPEARKFVAVAPYHGYDYKHYDKIAQLVKRYPDLPFWMTEFCYAYEAGISRSKTLPVYDFDDGDYWGNTIFSDISAGASAWIYWNMILDEKGGPWAVSPIHGNPDPNEQHPVVIINQHSHEITYTGTYYYLTHFSKFVRPGSVRIGATGNAKGVRVLGFVAPEGELVAELMNSGREKADVAIVFHGREAHLALPARSITTARWNAKE
jgi:glucosylceramidase